LDTNFNVRQKFLEARSSASAQSLSASSASVQCLRIVRGTFTCLPDSPRNNSPDQICVVTSLKHVFTRHKFGKTLRNARRTTLCRVFRKHPSERYPDKLVVAFSRPRTLPSPCHVATTQPCRVFPSQVKSGPVRPRPGQGKSTLVESKSQMSPSLSPTLSFLALYLRSPGLVSWHSTCALPVFRQVDDLAMAISMHAHLCRPRCRTPLSILAPMFAKFLQIMVGTMCTLLIFACLSAMSISVPLADLAESPTTDKERQALETLQCRYRGVIGELMWDRSTCHPHMITCSPARPSLSPTLSFMALSLRSPGCFAKSMIFLLPSVKSRRPAKTKFLRGIRRAHCRFIKERLERQYSIRHFFEPSVPTPAHIDPHLRVP
jgi:hypothetical protein